MRDRDPLGLGVGMENPALLRRRARYWCSRLRNEHEGGCPADGCPPKLRAYYEGLKGFPGWLYFAVTWDLDEYDPLRIVPRAMSVHEEWHARLARVVPELPLPDVGAGAEGAEEEVSDG